MCLALRIMLLLGFATKFILNKACLLWGCWHDRNGKAVNPTVLISPPGRALCDTVPRVYVCGYFLSTEQGWNENWVLEERKPPGACPKYNSYCEYEHIFGGLMLASAWTALYSPFQRSLTVAENTQRHLTWLGHVAELLEIASVLSLECKAAPSFMHVSQANNGYCYSAVVKS